MPVDDFLRALGAELATRFGDRQPSEVDTIYLGGGTPSRLGGDGVARAIELVQRQFHPSNGAEITIEANPDDVTPDATKRWRSAGVNRVSLGAQSFDPHLPRNGLRDPGERLGDLQPTHRGPHRRADLFGLQSFLG